MSQVNAKTSASALIWKTMSSINVNEHTEKKGNLTYLSWTWALQTLMDKFPNTEFNFTDRSYDDGTMEVTCRLTIVVDECDPSVVSRTMFLPVMDNRNNAIQNPDARKVSDAKMRCLVKTIAVTTGLGLYIFAGEDIPKAESDAKKSVVTKEQINLMVEGLEHSGIEVSKFMSFYKVNKFDEMTGEQYEHAMHSINKRIAANAAMEQQ